MVQVPCLTAILVDADPKRGPALREVLTSAGVDVRHLDGTSSVSVPPAIDLLVIHNTDRHLWQALDRQARFELAYSGNPAKRAAQPNSPVHFFRDPMTEASVRAPAFARRLARFVEDLRSRPESLPDWDRLYPADNVALLSALAILCQGYLSAYAAAISGDREAPCADALARMGWRESFAELVGEDVRKRWVDVKAPGWWKQVIGDLREDSPTLAAELSGVTAGAVVALVRALASPDEIGPRLVAEAYLELAPILSQGGDAAWA